MSEEMKPHFEKYYEQGLSYFELENYLEAATCFKKAANYKKHHAESWHLAGISLIKQQRQAEGGMYLQRALNEYEDRIEKGILRDHNLYQKACIHAFFKDKEPLLQSLKDALSLNSNIAEEALQEVAFKPFYEDEDFLATLETHLKRLYKLRYKGKNMRKEDLNEDQINKLKVFIEELNQHDWETEDYEEQLSSDEGVAPQAFATYENNPHLFFAIGYYIDENLIYLELQSREDEDDIQAYRIYQSEDIKKIILVIIQFQDKLMESNWTDLIEELVDLCDSLLFELPDGRKVRVA